MAELLTGFPRGNIEKYAPLLQSQLPRLASLLFKTIDPVICASLIELLGNNTRFHKQLGMINPRQEARGQFFEIRLVFSVPDFIGFGGGSGPIEADRDFILSKLQQIPGVKWEKTSVHIMPQDGTVTITFDLPVAAAGRQ